MGRTCTPVGSTGSPSPFGEGYRLQNSNIDFLHSGPGNVINPAPIYDGFRVGRFKRCEVPRRWRRCRRWSGIGESSPHLWRLRSHHRPHRPCTGHPVDGHRDTHPGNGVRDRDDLQQHVVQRAGSPGGVSHWWYTEGGGRATDEWAGGPTKVNR